MTWLASALISAFIAVKLPTRLLWVLVVIMLGFAGMNHHQAWGTYHYYMGSKYFYEVGYFDLYECTHREANLRRDLRTYNFTDTFPDCPNTFTLQRWLEFHQDLKRVDWHAGMSMDKGPNMTPTWIVASLLLIDIGFDVDQLVWLDYIVMWLAMMLLVKLLGWRKSAYIALWTLCYYGTINLLFGHYGQWWWLASVLVGMALINTKRSWGGALVGVSATLAVFPAFVMLFHWRNKQAIIAFIVGAGIAGGVGLLNPRGFDGYLEFMENMKIHSNYIRTEGCCNSGLAHSLAYAENDIMPYFECYTGMEDCQSSYEHNYSSLWWLMFLPALLASPFGVMFGFLTLSILYWQILSVVVIEYDERWTRYLFALNAIIIAWMLVDRMPAYFYAGWLLYIFFAVMSLHKLGVWLWDDRLPSPEALPKFFDRKHQE